MICLNRLIDIASDFSSRSNKMVSKKIEKPNGFIATYYFKYIDLNKNGELIPVSQMVSFNFFPPTVSCLILKSTPGHGYKEIKHSNKSAYNKIN